MTPSFPRRVLVTACLLAAAHAASAANEYTLLLKGAKFAEAEKLADAKLATDPANADALVAKTRAILGAGPESRIDQAVKLGEQCMAAHPQSAPCHIAYGSALGSKAINAGVFSAMGYVGKIRDAFKKAVELEPTNLDARFSLLQFYMQAPSIAGGGSKLAKELATQTATVSPDGSRLMFATIDLDDDQYAKAEAAIVAVRPAAGNEALQEKHEQAIQSLAGAYLNEKKYADAERMAQELVKRYPDSEWGPYMQARVQQEQGKPREALASFEKALTLAQRPLIHYRIGQVQQALNDKAKAVAAYERALAPKTGLSKKSRSDAEDQIKALKG